MEAVLALVGRCTALLRHPRLTSPAVKRGALAVALAVFAVGLWMSYESQPDVLDRFDWRPALFVVLVTVPVTLVLNAVEYTLLARQIGLRAELAGAIQLALLSTAANALPLPGSAMVRIGALTAAGASIRAGTGATVLGALVWIAVAFLYAGVALATASAGWIAVAFVSVGGAALIAALAAIGRTPGGYEVGVLVIANRTLNVTMVALRFYACLMALGHEPEFVQAAATAVSGVIGAAAVVVPAGIGVRELVTTALAPLVALSPALAFLAATLSRVLGYSALLMIALLLLAWKTGAAYSEPPA